jgi:hypothetical protein
MTEIKSLTQKKKEKKKSIDIIWVHIIWVYEILMLDL